VIRRALVELIAEVAEPPPFGFAATGSETRAELFERIKLTAQGGPQDVIASPHTPHRSTQPGPPGPRAATGQTSTTAPSRITWNTSWRFTVVGP
jgi:hypothetical protein